MPDVSPMTRWFSSVLLRKKLSFRATGLHLCPAGPGGPRPRAATPSPGTWHRGSSGPAQSLLPSGPTGLPPRDGPLCVSHSISLGLGKRAGFLSNYPLSFLAFPGPESLPSPCPASLLDCPGSCPPPPMVTILAPAHGS